MPSKQNILWNFREDEIQWVFVTLEDTFALPENLRYYVATMDPQNHHYLGHAMKFWNIIYNWAGEYTILILRPNFVMVISKWRYAWKNGLVFKLSTYAYYILPKKGFLEKKMEIILK